MAFVLSKNESLYTGSLSFQNKETSSVSISNTKTLIERPFDTQKGRNLLCMNSLVPTSLVMLFPCTYVHRATTIQTVETHSRCDTIQASQHIDLPFTMEDSSSTIKILRLRGGAPRTHRTGHKRAECFEELSKSEQKRILRAQKANTTQTTETNQSCNKTDKRIRELQSISNPTRKQVKDLERLMDEKLRQKRKDPTQEVRTTYSASKEYTVTYGLSPVDRVKGVEYLFDENELQWSIEGHIFQIPDWMRNMRSDRLEPFIKSFIADRYTPTNPQDAERHKNLVRFAKDILQQKDKNSPSFATSIKNFVVQLQDANNLASRKLPTTESTLQHHKYDSKNSHDFKIDTIEIYSSNSVENILHKWASRLSVKRWQFPMVKVYSLAREFAQSGKTLTDMLTLIDKKTPIFSSADVYDTSDKFEKNEKWAWFLPYANPRLFSLDVADERLYIRHISNQLSSLKSKIIRFAESEYHYRKMSSKQQLAVKLAHKELVKEYMRKARFQSYFAQGHSSSQIADIIMQQFGEQIRFKAANCELYNECSKQNNDKARAKRISSLRRQKYLDSGYFGDYCEGFDAAALPLPIVQSNRRPAIDIQEEGANALLNDEHIEATCVIPKSALYFNLGCIVLIAFYLVLTRSYEVVAQSNPSKLETSGSYHCLTFLMFVYPLWSYSKKIGNAIVEAILFIVGDAIRAKCRQNILSYLGVSEDDAYNTNTVAINAIVDYIQLIYAACIKDWIMFSFSVARLAIAHRQSVMDKALEIFNSLKNLFNVEPYLLLPVNQKCIRITRQCFREMCHLYDTQDEDYNQKVKALLASQQVQTQSMSGQDTLRSLAAMMIPGFDLGLSHQDVQIANAQFTFFNNVKRDIVDKATLLKNLVSFVFKMFFSYDPFDPEYRQLVSERVNYIASVNDIKLRTHTLASDRALWIAIEGLYKQGKFLTDNPRNMQLPGYLQTSLQASLREITSLFNRAIQHSDAGKARVEPVLTMFTGPAGTGKSTAIEFAQKAICHVLGDVYSNEMTYHANLEDGFWEGYSGQKFVVYDDAFQSTDLDHRRNEGKSIIHAINTVPYNLPMAFDGKGSTFFKSDFVWMTTNIADQGFHKANFNIGLTSAKAFTRRVAISLHRQQPVDPNAPTYEQYWTIEVCEIPKYVGKEMMLKDIVLIFKEIHDLHAARQINLTTSQNDLDMLYPKQDIQQQSLATDASEMVTLLHLMVQHKIVPWFNKPNWKHIVAAASGALSIYLAYDFFKGGLVSQYFTPEADNQSKPFKVPTGRRRFRAITKLYAQSNPVNFDNTMKGTLSRALVHIASRGYKDQQAYLDDCVGLHIRSGYILVPKHFFKPCLDMEDVQFDIKWSGHHIVMKFPKKYIVLDGVDLAMFPLPARRNLTPSACYNNILDQVNAPYEGTSLEFATYRDNEYSYHSVHAGPSGQRQYSCVNEIITIKHPVTYAYSTVRGQSGSAVIRCNPDGSASIIGIHVAYQSMPFRHGFGIATPIDKQLIDAMIEHFEPIKQSNPFPMSLYGEMDQAYFMPNQSKLREGPLHNWKHECTTKPAHLKQFFHEGVSIDPYRLALTKLHQEETVVDMGCTRRVKQYLHKLYASEAAKPILTWDEALNGVEGTSMTKISYSTSAGYPWNLESNKGKDPFITKVVDGDLMKLAYDPNFLLEMEEYHDSLVRGEQIEVLWGDTLKDETRELEKVDAGKTRLFTIGPIHYLILVRRYFMSFVTHVQDLAASHPVTVGINPHSLDWTQLYNRLTTKGKSIIAGDFSNFDGKLPAQVGRVFLDFVNEWYDDGDDIARIRTLLMEHIFAAVHVHGNIAYQVRDGNPSGNPITSIYNSFCNIIMCHTILTKDFNLSDDSFELAVYGDDNILAVELNNLRASDFTPYFKRRFDMDYTHWSKKDSESYDTMETISFLGRKFVEDSGIIRAPLSLQTIVESTYFYKKPNNPCDVLLATADSFFLELAHHPEHVFDSLSKEFRQAVRNNPETQHLADIISKNAKTYDDYFDSRYRNHNNVEVVVEESDE